mgnify:CR=1 FL=1
MSVYDKPQYGCFNKVFFHVEGLIEDCFMDGFRVQIIKATPLDMSTKCWEGTWEQISEVEGPVENFLEKYEYKYKR